MNRVLFILIAVMFWAPGQGMAQVSPDQATHLLTVRDAAVALGEAIIKAGGGNEVKVTVSGAREEDALAATPQPISAEVDGLELDKPHNRWQATLLLKSGGKNLAPVKLAGRYEEMIQVPVLKRRMQSGDVIGKDDVDWDQQPAAHLRKNTVTDIKDLIGKSPKRMISQGRPIRQDEIASPAIINKGAHVTLLFKSRNLEISTLGEAMDNGAKGDVIRVKNITSKAIIEGTVETGDRVRISAPGATAEAM